MNWWHELARPDSLRLLKGTVAALACVLLVVEPRLLARLRPAAVPRVRTGGTILFGAVALVAFFQLFRFPDVGYLHSWEMYHYYVGAKYAPELGYERLYACTTIADAEAGIDVQGRLLRDLRDDTLIGAAAVVGDVPACKAHFTPERWSSFTTDLAAFRRLAGSRRTWERMQLDHGYNPSPVWTVLGREIAARIPPTPRALRALAFVDVGLIASGLLALAWGFGWRLAALSALYLGTQAPAGLEWTGGAFLRYDWWFLVVCAVALLRRGRPFLAGFALGWAGLLRVFPLLFWAGPLVMLARDLAARKGVSLARRRLLLGGLCAACTLLPAASVALGPRSFAQFFDHVTMHAQTPIDNHMSLRSLFSYVPQERRRADADRVVVGVPDAWTAARQERLRALEPWFVLASGALLALFVACVWRLRTPWLGVVLSLLPVIVLTDPSCYYFSMYVIAVALGRARRSLEVTTVGLAAIGQFVALRCASAEALYVALAAVYVVFSTILVVMFVRPPRGWGASGAPRPKTS